MQKKILIIEPLSTGGRDLVASCVREGYEIHAVTHKDLYENSYDDGLRRSIYQVLFTNFCFRTEAIEDMVNYCKTNAINGVVAGFEFMSDFAVIVANDLGLPTHDVLKADALRQKDKMYRWFVEGAVPCAKTVVVEHQEDLDTALSEIGFPCVMKPSSDAGSYNVFGIRKRIEAYRAFEVISGNQYEFPHRIPLHAKVLVQEHLSGPEISVELAVKNGTTYVLAITDKITSSGQHFAEIRHVIPSKVSPKLRVEIDSVVSRACFALGIHNGVAHVEAKLTSSGIKVVEVGARMPGGKIPVLLLNALGLDEGAIYAKLALGEDIVFEPTFSRFSAIRFLYSETNGILQSVENPYISQEVLGIGIQETSVYRKPGDAVHVLRHNGDRFGHVISIGSTYEEAIHITENALKNIRIKVGAE